MSMAQKRKLQTLVVDVGGNHVKVRATGVEEEKKIESGPALSAARMASSVKRATRGWKYDRVTIGFPGAVVGGKVALEPPNLGRGWVGFDFRKAFGKPVMVVNDAAMQALGSYEGGRMLFLGLGTGLGTTLIVDGTVVAMEMAHMPYKKKTFEDYVGERGLKRMGKKKWERAVADVVAVLTAGLLPDYVVLGGGNVKKMKSLPEGARAGDNGNAFAGGVRMWDVKQASASH